MLPKSSKTIRRGRTCDNSSDNRLKTRNQAKQLSSQPNLFSSCTLPSLTLKSFVAATLFIERLLQNEDHVFNIIDQCQNDPTLSLDLQLILEAATTEKQLEDKLGYKDDNVLRLHTIVVTAIAAAIRHGILNTIRDSKKLPVVPDYIPSHFAGQGIVQYFEKFDAQIHAYGKKFPTSPRITAYHPYRRTPTPRCSKCKNSVIFARTVATTNVEDVFGGDQDIPPLTVKQRKKPKEYGKTKEEGISTMGI
jgi:hypothetical protein